MNPRIMGECGMEEVGFGVLKATIYQYLYVVGYVITYRCMNWKTNVKFLVFWCKNYSTRGLRQIHHGP